MPQYPYSTAESYSYAHISGAAQTLSIKNKAGMVGIVTFNTIANAGTLTLYDNPTAGSGAAIAVFTVATTTATPYRVEMDVLLVNGLTIVTTGANNDYTIMYR